MKKVITRPRACRECFITLYGGKSCLTQSYSDSAPGGYDLGKGVNDNLECDSRICAVEATWVSAVLIADDQGNLILQSMRLSVHETMSSCRGSAVGSKVAK